ncbi:hypothetical protein [Neisseria meningitidis]|uniref:hypothetical protein n=1 Tax=Neisseria meningitidis TaxID=487 RepID=UPI003C780B3F
MQKDIRREGNPSGFYREDRIHHRIADIAPARTAYAVPGNQGRLSKIFFGISFRQIPNRKRAGRNSRPADGVAAMPSEATNPASDGICLPKSK